MRIFKIKVYFWASNIYFLHQSLCFFLLKVSFVIPPDVIPGRMTLLVTLVLVSVNIFINVISQSPNTKSLTSVSTWMIFCNVFICGSLLEYGCILFYKKHAKNYDAEKFLTLLDSLSLVISIAAFIVFNIIFWNIQLS